jgi:hypothetical protein
MQKEILTIIAAFFVIGILLMAGSVWLGWYQSGLQAEVYRRAGVEMTQWEVFCGVKPPDRVIRFAD